MMFRGSASQVARRLFSTLSSSAARQGRRFTGANANATRGVRSGVGAGAALAAAATTAAGIAYFAAPSALCAAWPAPKPEKSEPELSAKPDSEV